MRDDDLESYRRTRFELAKLLDGVVPLSSELFRLSSVPPPALRWFVVGYIFALAASVPTSTSTWMEATSFFVACGAGLLGIAKFRKLRSSASRSKRPNLRRVK